MDSGPGKLVGEDYRGREREVCAVMANDGNGSMEVDGVGVGGGATLATARGAPVPMDVASAQRGVSLDLQGGAGAGIGGAAADRTGRAGAEENVATAGSTESQGLAALEASLHTMLQRPIWSRASPFSFFYRFLAALGMRGQVHELPGGQHAGAGRLCGDIAGVESARL